MMRLLLAALLALSGSAALAQGNVNAPAAATSGNCTEFGTSRFRIVDAGDPCLDLDVGLDQAPLTADVPYDFNRSPFAGNWASSRAANVLSSSLAEPNFYPRTTLALNRAARGGGTILTNPFATTDTSTTVVVTHAGHGLTNGLIANIANATAVGGLTLSGDYAVANVVANVSYEITAASPATSTVAAGGGTVYVSKSADNGPDRTNTFLAGFSEKQDWRTSLTYGEIDGVFLATSQGVRGDTGGINVGAYKIDGRTTGGEGSALGIEAHAFWVSPDYAQEPFAPNAQTVTITQASPAVLTAPATTNLTTGKGVTLSTTEALPTGLSAATKYYAIAVTSTTFRLATTYANAAAGTAINTSDAGSGVHTYTLSNNLSTDWEVATVQAYAEAPGAINASLGQGDGMGMFVEGRSGHQFTGYAAVIDGPGGNVATSRFAYMMSTNRNQLTTKWGIEDDGTERHFNAITNLDTNFDSAVSRWVGNRYQFGTDDNPGSATVREWDAIRNGVPVLLSTATGVSAPGEVAAGSLNVNAGGSVARLVSGLYTPTCTTVLNLFAATCGVNSGHYQCIGDECSVSVLATLDPTAASTTTELRISLPIASALVATRDVVGTATTIDPNAIGAGTVLADTTNDDAKLEAVVGATDTSQVWTLTFQYSILAP